MRYKRLISYFIHTPIRLNDGRRYKKRGGVPSGSGFTNLIDSIVNAIVTRYSLYHTTGSLPFADLYMGDDSFFASESPISIESLAEFISDVFGMVINVNKSWVTNRLDMIHFLGYYNKDGVAIKPQDTILASFIYPERKPDSIEVTCARALGQLWSCMEGISGRIVRDN